MARACRIEAAGYTMHVSFGGERGEPVAISTSRPYRGHAVAVDVTDFDPLTSKNVFLLHHKGFPDIIIAATTRRESAERIFALRGRGAVAFRLACVPVAERPFPKHSRMDTAAQGNR
jgi:hypothetical protein